jgi:hypothetical protein
MPGAGVALRQSRVRVRCGPDSAQVCVDVAFEARFVRGAGRICGLTDPQECQAAQPAVEALMFPRNTVMDLASTHCSHPREWS